MKKQNNEKNNNNKKLQTTIKQHNGTHKIKQIKTQKTHQQTHIWKTTKI